MISVSTDFKRSVFNENNNFLIRLEITLQDDTRLTVENDNIMSNGLLIDDAVSEDEDFTALGSTIINACDVILYNNNNVYSDYEFKYAKVTVYIGLNVGGTLEEFKRGVFTVDDAVYGDVTISLSLLDNMAQFDRPYSESSLVYPATLLDIVRDACSVCDVPFATNSLRFPHYTFNVATKPSEESTTFREVIGWAATIAGCYARCNTEGELEFKWFDVNALDTIHSDAYDGGTFNPWSEGDTVDGGTFNPWSAGNTVDGGTFQVSNNVHYISSLRSQSLGVDDVVITGVRITVEIDDPESDEDIIQATAGTDDYLIEIEGNQFITVTNMATVLNWLATQLIGLRFRKCNIQTLGNPIIEAGDVALVWDSKGVEHPILVTRASFSPTSLQEIVCGAAQVTRNSAVRFSEQTKSYVAMRKQLRQQRNTYDAAIEDLNDKIENASGLHKTEVTQPGGATITYYHNKPELSDSDIQIVISNVGITVTSNGTDEHPTWYGLEVNGTLIASIMNTIGINFDWGVGGELIIKSGNTETFYANAETGVVRIRANSFSLSNGDTIDSIAQGKANTALQEAKTYTNTVIDNYSTEVDAIIANLQDQIDGQIESWYYDYEPTLNNIPASNWTTESDKKAHEGDVFYWDSMGYAYRFMNDNGTWKWKLIEDSQVTQAIQLARKAQDTADNKRRVFVATPTPPYDIGDLWVQGTTGDILRCSTSKATGASYSANDWVKASKYTDDTLANQALETINTLEIGGRNLIHNTNVIDLSETTSRPNINGDNLASGYLSATSGTLTAAVHGAKITSTSAVRPGFIFGSNTPSASGTHGLAVGREYTFSCDWETKTLGGNAVATTTYYLRAYLYYATSTSASSMTAHSYATWYTFSSADTSDRNTVVSGHGTFTFTVPEDAVAWNIRIYSTNGTTASWYAAGNYLQIENIKLEVGQKATAWTPAPEDINSEINGINVYLETLQDQVDGKAETFYQANDPSTNWSTVEKTNHTGDLWYRTTDGVTLRYSGSTWQEQDIPNIVFDQIDGKAQIFVSQPEPPYNVGDLWVQGSTGDILRCSTPKEASDDYAESDWSLASKYTDDTLAEVAIETINTLEIGGRNLFINTNTPSATGAKRPKLIGQIENTAVNGTAYVVEHGIGARVSNASRTVVRFGANGNGSITPTMNGLEAGKTYTLSFDCNWKAMSAASSGTTTKMTAYLYDDRVTQGTLNWVRIKQFATATAGVEGSARCEGTFTIPNNVTMCFLYIGPENSTASNYASGDYIELRNLKLEKGQKATAWSPAIEDIEAEISELGEDLQAQIDGKIQTWYQSSDPSTSWSAEEKSKHEGDLWHRTTDNVNLRYSGSAWVEQAISNEVFDAIDGKSTIYYGRPTATYSNVEAGDYLVDSTDGSTYRWSGSAWVTMTDYATAIDNIEIGGKNMITGTNVVTELTATGTWSNRTWRKAGSGTGTVTSLNITDSPDKSITKGWQFDVTNVGNTNYSSALCIGQNAVKLVADKQYTISCYAKGSGQLFMFCGISSYIGGKHTVTSEWARYSTTFVLNASTAYVTSNGSNVFFGASVTGASISICGMRLEEGSKATAWSPAPEDIDAAIGNVAAEFTAFIDGSYANFVTATNNAINGKITTYYSESIPATHNTGDLWIDTDDSNKLYRWNGSSWVSIRDSGIQNALTAAGDARTIADSKIVTFAQASQPTATDEGDLWIDTDDNNKIYRWSGTAWVAYTDTSALNIFINGSYAPTVTELRGQIDSKAETWYQENDPATNWSTADKAKHIGDLWYRTTDNKTFRYTGSSWQEQNVPTEVFDKLDKKAQIFVAQPVPPYAVGDLWVQGSSGDIMQCSNSRATGSYTASDWVKASKYTDDSAVTALNNALTQQEVFNRLTNNGQAQGIFLEADGKLYVNAEYLVTGRISDVTNSSYWDLTTGEMNLVGTLTIKIDKVFFAAGSIDYESIYISDTTDTSSISTLTKNGIQAQYINANSQLSKIALIPYHAGTVSYSAPDSGFTGNTFLSQRIVQSVYNGVKYVFEEELSNYYSLSIADVTNLTTVGYMRLKASSIQFSAGKGKNIKLIVESNKFSVSTGTGTAPGMVLATSSLIIAGGNKSLIGTANGTYLSWGGKNLAYVSSSSKRYKKEIEELKDENLDPHKLYDLQPKQFKYNKDAPLQYPDMEDKLIPGFIAEEVAEIYPSAVIYDDDKRIESWDERRIIPGMLSLIQEQKQKIDELEERIARLEKLLLKEE